MPRASAGLSLKLSMRFTSGHFDLVLLEVQMPDGTGFDVIREVGSQQMPAVVFVTACDKYAIHAFEVNAVDYPLRPLDDLRLRESIERARERMSRSSDLMRHLESLLEARGDKWAQRLIVRTGDRFDFVPVDSIDWIESPITTPCPTAVPRTTVW